MAWPSSSLFVTRNTRQAVKTALRSSTTSKLFIQTRNLSTQCNKYSRQNQTVTKSSKWRLTASVQVQNHRRLLHSSRPVCNTGGAPALTPQAVSEVCIRLSYFLISTALYFGFRFSATKSLRAATSIPRARLQSGFSTQTNWLRTSRSRTAIPRPSCTPRKPASLRE